MGVKSPKLNLNFLTLFLWSTVNNGTISSKLFLGASWGNTFVVVLARYMQPLLFFCHRGPLKMHTKIDNCEDKIYWNPLSGATHNTSFCATQSRPGSFSMYGPPNPSNANVHRCNKSTLQTVSMANTNTNTDKFGLYLQIHTSPDSQHWKLQRNKIRRAIWIVFAPH